MVLRKILLVLSLIQILKQQFIKHICICHYWYLLDKGFKYEPYLYNGYHDLMQEVINFKDVAIFSVKESDYRIHFCYMSKYDAVSIMENCNLNEEGELLLFFYII